MLGMFTIASFAQEQKKVEDNAAQAVETTEVKADQAKETVEATPVSNEEVKAGEQFEPAKEEANQATKQQPQEVKEEATK